MRLEGTTGMPSRSPLRDRSGGKGDVVLGAECLGELERADLGPREAVTQLTRGVHEDAAAPHESSSAARARAAGSARRISSRVGTTFPSGPAAATVVSAATMKNMYGACGNDIASNSALATR